MRIITLIAGIAAVLLSMDALSRVFSGGSLLWLWLPVLTVAAIVEYCR